LLSYSGNADMWDDNSGGHDSKFGIYRSLDERNMLRDEQVRFADFCASKVGASECDDGSAPPVDAGGVVDVGGLRDSGRQMDASRGTGGGGGSAGATGGTGIGGSGGDVGTGGSGGDVGTGGSGGDVGTGGSGGGLGASGTSGALTPDASHSTPQRGPSELVGGCSCKLGSSGASTSGAVAFAGMVACALELLRRRRKRCDC